MTLTEALRMIATRAIQAQESNTMINDMRRGEYTITTDRDRLDLAAIHDFLTHSYWSPGVPLEVVAAPALADLYGASL